MSSKLHIGYAGLGIMGSRMARRFLATGYPLTVWNRTRARGDELAAQGAQVSVTPADLAKQADIICLCVTDPPALLSTLEAMRPGLKKGQRLLDFSTIGPEAARRAAALCAEAGAFYVEAPVTGSRGAAQDGTLLIMVGGDEKIVESLREVLAVVSRQAIYCGPHGCASTVKLIGNNLIAHMLVGLAQGLAVAREAGIAGEKVLEVVQSSGFASPYYSFKGKPILARDFDTYFSVDLLHKDLKLFLSVAEPLRVPLAAAATMTELMQDVRARGWGGEDICAVAKVFDVAKP